tara:strand:- start:537 stop:770 length:234 start_codon:yes stop_codon:yes gene_type:complete
LHGGVGSYLLFHMALALVEQVSGGVRATVRARVRPRIRARGRGRIGARVRARVRAKVRGRAFSLPHACLARHMALCI